METYRELNKECVRIGMELVGAMGRELRKAGLLGIHDICNNHPDVRVLRDVSEFAAQAGDAAYEGYGVSLLVLNALKALEYHARDSRSDNREVVALVKKANKFLNANSARIDETRYYSHLKPKH
jgi:hypothetical protein